MLRIFRRHLKRCPHTSRDEWNCQCPIHVEGKLGGEMIRKTLAVRSREAALKIVRDWEIAGRAESVVTVEDAGTKSIDFCESKHLALSTMKKYRLLVKELKAEFGTIPVNKIAVDDLDGNRKSWGMGGERGAEKVGTAAEVFPFLC